MRALVVVSLLYCHGHISALLYCTGTKPLHPLLLLLLLRNHSPSRPCPSPSPSSLRYCVYCHGQIRALLYCTGTKPLHPLLLRNHSPSRASSSRASSLLHLSCPFLVCVINECGSPLLVGFHHRDWQQNFPRRAARNWTCAARNWTCERIALQIRQARIDASLTLTISAWSANSAMSRPGFLRLIRSSEADFLCHELFFKKYCRFPHAKDRITVGFREFALFAFYGRVYIVTLNYTVPEARNCKKR